MDGIWCAREVGASHFVAGVQNSNIVCQESYIDLDGDDCSVLVNPERPLDTSYSRGGPLHSTIIRAPIDVLGKERGKQFCVVFVPSDDIILPRLADGGFVGVCRGPLPAVNLRGGDHYQKHNCNAIGSGCGLGQRGFDQTLL